MKELIRQKRLKICFSFCSKIDRNIRLFAKNRAERWADGSNARLYVAITKIIWLGLRLLLRVNVIAKGKRYCLGLALRVKIIA